MANNNFTPAHFNTVNAVADAAINALTPSAAANTWTKQPAVIPRPATTPALAPERSALLTMYNTSGPGVRFSSNPAPMNNRRCWKSGTAA